MEERHHESAFSNKTLKVVCNYETLSEHPHCAHGPTLLFQCIKNGSMKEFFACSAFRDQKECNFFMLKKNWKDNENAASNKFLTIKNQIILGKNIVDIKLGSVYYCHHCNTFSSTATNSKLKCNHNIEKISQSLFETPTKFLRPLSDDKALAQYFFKEKTLEFITRMLAQLKIKKVICIGVPSLHENLKKSYFKIGINSILLDLDHRLFNFNLDSEFFHFNMFNYHFFEGERKKKLFKRFLITPKNETILLITDPPFGCRTEPLASVIKQISNDFRELNHDFRILPVVWIFPYFMEQYIKNEMPEMEMLDYKVNYINHQSYSDNDKARKQGSPVRLFTNIPLKLIELPLTEGYKNCNICQKWTAMENIHCKICNLCPSKNGEQYRHCNLCAKCVKPNYFHCKVCRRCTQKANHNCSIFQKVARCWICNQTGHLEPNCINENQQYKRKIFRLKENHVRICLICFKKGHNENQCKKNSLRK